MNDLTIPGADSPHIPEEKLRGYLLNPEHADGTHKLRVLRAAFGIGPDDWEQLAIWLVEGLQRGTVTGTRRRDDCIVLGVSFTLPGIDGEEKRMIASWKVAHEGGPPTFVTAYLDTRNK